MAFQPTRGSVPHFSMRPHPMLTGAIESESDIEILRLARAVNLEMDQDLRRLKEKVRTGLKELEQKGYLEQYQITKDNRVIISKSKDSAAHFQSQILDTGEMSFLSE